VVVHGRAGRGHRLRALQTADGRAIEIETLRPAKDCFVARLKGVADRDAAAMLRNMELYVARERLPAPEPDEFYLADWSGSRWSIATAGRSARSLRCMISAPARCWNLRRPPAGTP